MMIFELNNNVAIKNQLIVSNFLCLHTDLLLRKKIPYHLEMNILSQHYTEVFISRVECYVGKMNKIFQFSFMSSWKKLANWISFVCSSSI